MMEDTWKRALKISACWIGAATGIYLFAFALVRFFFMREYLFLVILPSGGILLAWISPLALGQIYRSWKVAWTAFGLCFLAVPLALSIIFGVFLTFASPR